MALVILADVTAFVIEEVLRLGAEEDDFEWPVYVLACTLFLYTTEIVIKLICFHCYGFFQDRWNAVDLLIVLNIIVLAVLIQGFGGQDGSRSTRLGNIVLRSIGGIMKVVRVYLRTGLLAQAGRQKVSKNKTRFVDLDNNMNLDLTYVADNLIAMGVPASGLLNAFLRNPLSDVARFFKINHSGHFRVYNLCPEMPYSDSLFKQCGGTVYCFAVQDHTPPLMDQFVGFLKDAREFYKRDDRNVLAVHCKAGKGRTGCFCCAWLLYEQSELTAEEAMSLFAERRTNTGLGKKLRGVETPSQIRYVKQLFEHLRRTNSWLHTSHIPPDVPKPEIRLTRLCLEGGFIAHPAKTKGLRVLVQCFGSVPPRAETVLETETLDPSVEAVPLQDVAVRGDMRIALFEVKQSSRSFSAHDVTLAADNFNKAKGLLAYFWLHTGFLWQAGDAIGGPATLGPSRELGLGVEQVDKASKGIQTDKRRGRFTAGSRLVLHYAACGDVPPPSGGKAATLLSI